MLDCVDVCPKDKTKTTDSGACGCNAVEIDFDGDGSLDCGKNCTNEPMIWVTGVSPSCSALCPRASLQDATLLTQIVVPSTTKRAVVVPVNGSVTAVVSDYEFPVYGVAACCLLLCARTHRAARDEQVGCVRRRAVLDLAHAAVGHARGHVHVVVDVLAGVRSRAPLAWLSWGPLTRSAPQRPLHQRPGEARDELHRFCVQCSV